MDKLSGKPVTPLKLKSSMISKTSMSTELQDVITTLAILFM